MHEFLFRSLSCCLAAQACLQHFHFVLASIPSLIVCLAALLALVITLHICHEALHQRRTWSHLQCALVGNRPSAITHQFLSVSPCIHGPSNALQHAMMCL